MSREDNRSCEICRHCIEYLELGRIRERQLIMTGNIILGGILAIGILCCELLIMGLSDTTIPCE